MVRTSLVAALLVAVPFAAGVVAQAPADFSGRWKVETTIETPATNAAAGAATLPRGDMGSGWGTTIAITHNASQLIVESILFPTTIFRRSRGSSTRSTVPRRGTR
jgi:hypothetical protein